MIAALRAVDGSQRKAATRHAMAAEAIKQDWLARIEVARVSDALSRYADGDDLDDCRDLKQLLTDHHAAREFIAGVAGPMICALRSQPLIEAPFRYKTSRGLSTIHLLTKGRAVLALSCYEPVEPGSWPTSAVFSDRCSTEMIVGGVAEGLVHERGSQGLHTRQERWRAGDTVVCTPLRSTRQIITVERSLVVLQLTRDAREPRATQEVSIHDGSVLRSASGDKSASQAVMALGVLGALGSHDALEVMARTALNQSEDPDVRWEALRQSLAIDAARGISLLSKLRAHRQDALSQPAGRLEASLLMAHPVLRAAALEAA